MINLTYVYIVSQLNKMEKIPKELLQSQIKMDHFSYPIITLLNLIKDAKFTQFETTQIRDYLLDLINKIDISNLQEQQWTLLYLLIYALDIKKIENIEYLNQMYCRLSVLPNTKYYKWLEYKINLAMLPLYDKNKNILIDKINSTDDTIIHLVD